ncbi:MAG: cytochrome c, partial [Bacteroidetes bacterium]
MKKNHRVHLFLAFLMPVILSAQPTFSEDIAPILYDNCTTCHRAGEIGPFPLESYEDAAAYAPMIKYVTGIRYMPPWKPDPDFSEFMGERRLTDQQIQLIADWADAGAPQGDPALAPDPPVFPTGSVIGTPDLVLSMKEAYHHEGDMMDEYRVFVLPTGLTEDKEVAAVELRPGNRKIVHHALFTYDDTGQAKALDDATPEYGYQAFGGFGVDEVFDRQFPGYVPGARPPFFQEGMGQRLPAGSDFLVQMHYAPVATDEVDSSSINIFFKKEPVTRFVEQYVMLPFWGTLTNGPFWIQPNQVKTFHGVYKVPTKVSILGIFPHMHLLGQDWTVYIVHANGDTTNLISIPDWDFNW